MTVMVLQFTNIRIRPPTKKLIYESNLPHDKAHSSSKGSKRMKKNIYNMTVHIGRPKFASLLK